MAYRRVKDKTHLVAMFKLPAHKQYYVHCYIWDSFEAMQEQTGEEGLYQACYVVVPFRPKKLPQSFEEREGFPRRKWGEIHLINGWFGAGVFAHELQHFLVDWWWAWDMDGSMENDVEDHCKMAGDMSAKFWNTVYDLGICEPGPDEE